jgi:MFS family permease
MNAEFAGSVLMALDKNIEEVNRSLPFLKENASPKRRAMWYVMVAWFFGAVWMYITTGAVLTQYAKSLHVTEFGFGLLAMLPYLGMLMQLPSSYILERYGYRKQIFLIFNLVHRLAWLGIAVIPWVLPASWGAASLLIMIAVSHMFSQFATPAWVSWMADMVPTRIRGRYFSRRTQFGQMVGLIVTILIGFLLDRAQVLPGNVFLKTLSVMLAVSALFGAMDIVSFFPVPDERTYQPNAKLKFWSIIRGPLADKNFRRFLGFMGTMTFAIGYIGQFVWLYLFDVVRMNNVQANIMLVVVPLCVTMLSYPIWGRLVDRLGRKPVLIIAGLLVVNGGAAWAFVRQENWWLGYIAVLLATAAWPGIEVGNFNLLLNMTVSKQGRSRQGSAYSAINSLVVSVAGILSGLFGGIIAYTFKDWHGTFFGWPLTYHGLLFLISAGLRLASLGWLIGLEDVGAQSTRFAMRYVVTSFYSNIQQAVFTPIRALGRLGKLSYRFRSKGE